MRAARSFAVTSHGGVFRSLLESFSVGVFSLFHIPTTRVQLRSYVVVVVVVFHLVLPFINYVALCSAVNTGVWLGIWKMATPRDD